MRIAAMQRNRMVFPGGKGDIRRRLKTYKAGEDQPS
jgi:hypothetical protein